MAHIDKTSRVPLHYQIYEDLFAQINSKRYQIGDKLPSETELMAFYGVSRITVRGAMKELEKEGCIEKFRGIGTIVSEPRANYDLQHLTSFSGDVKSSGGKSSSVLLQFELMVPDKKVVKALRLAEGEKVYFIKRFRLKDAIIAGLNCAYIKKVKGLELSPKEFTADSSLYALLEQKSVKLTYAEEVLATQMPDPELRKALNMDKNVPIFYRERVTYGNENEAIEYVEMFYRGDVFRYRMSLNL